MWEQVPVGHREKERARGGIVIRTTKAVAIEAGPRVTGLLRHLVLSLYRTAGVTRYRSGHPPRGPEPPPGS